MCALCLSQIGQRDSSWQGKARLGGVWPGSAGRGKAGEAW